MIFYSYLVWVQLLIKKKISVDRFKVKTPLTRGYYLNSPIKDRVIKFPFSKLNFTHNLKISSIKFNPSLTPRNLNFSHPLAEFHQVKILSMWACLFPPRKSNFPIPVAGVHLIKNLLTCLSSPRNLSYVVYVCLFLKAGDIS